MFTDQQLAANHLTPYSWEALTPAGVLMKAEDDPQRGQIPLKEAFRVEDQQGGGIRIFAEQDLRVRAKSHKPSVLPHMELDVPKGAELIWQHKSLKTQGINAQKEPIPGALIEFETMIFGVVLPDGPSEVHQVFPNGEHRAHQKLEEALSVT